MKWIKIKDKIPPQNKQILVFGSWYEEPYTAKVFVDKGILFLKVCGPADPAYNISPLNNNIKSGRITHWAEIELPKEE